jgi:hypothetical protein
MPEIPVSRRGSIVAGDGRDYSRSPNALLRATKQ